MTEGRWSCRCLDQATSWTSGAASCTATSTQTVRSTDSNPTSILLLLLLHLPSLVSPQLLPHQPKHPTTPPCHAAAKWTRLSLWQHHMMAYTPSRSTPFCRQLTLSTP